MPGNALAQLYVIHNGAGSTNAGVGEYDATSGDPIDANLISGINGVLTGLALSGNDLYLVNPNTYTVGEYNATTGAPINANLISLLTSAENFVGLALSGNILFVAGNHLNTVGAYNATTGAAINANLITATSPGGLALSGNDLFLADNEFGTISEYNATTGAVINANLITGLAGGPLALALSGNTLFVANYGNADNGTVGEYNALTGAAINANLVSGTYAPYTIAVAAVPEPSSWWMALGGAALLGVMRRKNTARDRHSLSNRFEDW